MISGKSVQDYVAIIQNLQNMLDNPIVVHAIVIHTYILSLVHNGAVLKEFPQVRAHESNFH